MKVIDISEHNGTIDFKKVKNEGITNVILRLGWIGNKNNHTIDKKFEEYYKLARKENFKIGIYVYNYCRNITSLISGISWVEKNISNKTFELGLFLDMEDLQISDLSKETLTNISVYFCNYFKNKGLISGIYANKYWFTTKLEHSKLLNYKIWWAEYNGKENHTSNLKVDLWQYSSKGKVNGINGNVDLNKCFCKEIEISKITGEKKEEYEMKSYVNGTTKEIVYQDVNCTKKIGFLNPHETACCYGLVNNKPLIVYNVDGTNNKKVGFVKWLGGLKN